VFTGLIVKPLDAQCFTGQKNSYLDLTGITRVIRIEQMAEVQRPRRTRSYSLQSAIPLPLIRPSQVESPALPKDVRSELTGAESGVLGL
jgi:hypothetical protein